MFSGLMFCKSLFCGSDCFGGVDILVVMLKDGSRCVIYIIILVIFPQKFR